ncbi:lipoate--protein ligase family protein [Thermodesulfovibrio yellowstonii]|uniref:lipoate--protein ligase family protein n=1 Tax=Thermodesulfovibrio yellowstonii TaxID=28262 RepID=UPI003C7D0A13
MGEKFRLIIDKIFDPAKHYALEEAMMRLMDEDALYPNTLRLRRVKKSALIGFFENPNDTINLDFAIKNKVKIVRRHNPGGTIYQDLGSFMFTTLYRDGRFLSNLSEEETYQEFGDLIIKFLSKFGIKGERRGLNDVVVNDRKIFGSSFIKIGDAISYTGTILVNMDLDFLSKLIKFNKIKYIDKKFYNIKDSLTTISRELNRKIYIKDAFDKFIEAFKAKFDIEVIKGKLVENEIKLMRKLYFEKYKKRDWTFSEKKEYEEIYTKKVKSGLIILRGKFEEKIYEIKIYGDFLISEREKISIIESNLKGKTFDKGIEFIKNLNLNEDLKIGLIELLNGIKKEKGGLWPPLIN